MLEERLEERSASIRLRLGASGPWFAGVRMTIADLANFAWINWAGIDVAQFKLIRGCLERINARPAIERGLDVPESLEMKRNVQTQ